MIYYIALVILILVLRNKVVNHQDLAIRMKYELKYCQIVCFIIILMAALRSVSVGTDTPGYLSDYLGMPFYDFYGIDERYEGYIGYYYTSKVFSLVDLPVQVWFGFVEALYVFAIFIFTKRFSKDKLLSILVFVTVGLFTFSLAGLKQVMSMSFMIFAFLSFLDKKYVLTVTFISIGFFCHSVGLIFLAAFPLYLIREKKYFLPMVVLTAILTILYGQLILATMVETLGNEHFEGYLEKDTSYTSVTLIFYVSILVMAFAGYKYYKQAESSLARFMLGMSVIVCVMQALSEISPNLFRLAICYAPFLMIFLPNSCYYAKNKTMTFFIIGSIVFYFLYTSRNTPYSFFWQA